MTLSYSYVIIITVIITIIIFLFYCYFLPELSEAQIPCLFVCLYVVAFGDARWCRQW